MEGGGKAESEREKGAINADDLADDHCTAQCI